MTRARNNAPARQPRRTPCNLAALMALGLMAGLAGPTLAATTDSKTVLNNVVLRGLVSDYANNATFAPVVGGPTGQTLAITQLVPKLILDWNRFDLANGDTIQFIQPSSTAAVLNRIYDKNPSTIAGAIKANGQVFLVNQNGILFNRGTQIDTNSFFASTLNISDDAFKAGVTSGGNFTPAFAGRYDDKGVLDQSAAGKLDSGRIAISGGAKINAAAGGAVVIIAPVINNDSGIIKSPDGQVILAAGRSVYLSFGDRDTTTSFRGMLVEVSAGDDKALNLSQLIAGSTVNNAGDVSADRGNVTLAGLAVNQSGHVSAKTAMLSNGSIYLQARTLNDAQRGSVTLSADSVTETPLDLADTTTLSQVTAFDPYRPVVNLTGKTIDVEGRITSPSGAVTLDAKDPASAGKARIYLGAGSSIDASGAWSTASDKSNLLTFKVTSTELKQAPDQQGGLLAGATVTVDLRQGSNVLDLTAYQNNQARTLAQKAAVGGVVTLSSSGDVIERSDATVNVSGGGVHYTGVTEATTKLVGADGKLYDIGSAPEALRYTTIADSFVDTQARWGFSPVYANLLMGASLKRPDYTQGAAGGLLNITPGAGVSGLVLDGALLGGTTTGGQQTGAAPRGAALVIGTFVSSAATQRTGVGDVTFQSGPTSSLAAGFSLGSSLTDYRKAQVSLSTDLFGTGTVDAAGNYVTTGFGLMKINADGRITVPENVTLNGPLGGALTLRANQVEIDGHVNLPGGVIVAQVVETAGTASSPISASGIVVNQGAGIAVTGAWINSAITGLQSPVPSALANPAGSDGVPVPPSTTLNGGSITLIGPVVDLAASSTLDVSAGGSVSAKGVFSGGAGGSIALAATAEPTASLVPLTLDGTLTGYGFGSGGTLDISTSEAVQILKAGVAAASSGLSLGAAFFDEGGFQSYKITASKDLTLVDGAILHPRQQSLQVDLPAALALATGANAQAAARFVTLTDDVRKPTSLALASSAKLTVQAGSGIGTDVGAAVSLTGVAGLAVDGTVYAPGGTISLSDSFTGVSLTTPDSALPVIELGSKAIVSTRGTFTAKANDRGLVLGSVAAGGSVTVAAGAAHLVMDAGSVIDVSGASHVVDIVSVPGASVPYREVLQASNAGSVSITANDSVVLGGAIRGTADAGAAGGAFSLRLTERGDIADATSGRRIVVTQAGAAQPKDASFKDTAVSVDKLRGAGFDKLSLAAEDQIVFADDATLAFQRGVTLDTKIVRVANDANAVVSGAAIKLANSYGARTLKTTTEPADHSTTLDTTLASPAQATVAGKGTLRLNADTLDVNGSVTISGTQSTTLAAVHDLRLSGRSVGQAVDAKGATLVGSLTTAGDLTLSAAQVYPTTGSTFTVAVADGLTGAITSKGKLTVTHGSGARGDVLSAGGKLTLKADRIAQDGVLEAPLGTLALQAGSTLTLGSTSVTSVSANGLTIPYGETQDGVTWTYGALGSNPLTASLTALPAKRISLDAPAVDLLTGAKVDVSGGGDVAAIEYVPSSAKSVDVLSKGANTYAILPAANLSAAPIDPDIASSAMGQLGSVYNSIHIGPGGAVPAGDYVLLPGKYALLKGGYLVQLLTGSTYANLQPGQTATLQNGLTVVPGVMTTAGTGLASAATLGVVVRQSTDIARLASYTVTHSAYFAKLADASRTAVPLLPADGGQLSIAATQRLTLNGTLAADLPGTTSRSAEVDISAARIALVDQVGRGDVGADYLQIDSAGLSKLNASLLIGGVRSTTSAGEILTPTATDIIVANSNAQPLKAPEVTLAATDSITVRAGSRIDGSGKQVVKPVDVTIVGAGAASGAVLRASDGGLATITRPTTDGSRGTITIESGATVAADGSLALDATQTTKSSGKLQVAKGGALSLVSGRVSLGETDAIAGLDSGLVLDNAALAGLGDLGTLSIKSYNGITLFGNAQVGSAALANLVLDSASLTGQSLAGDLATVVGRNVSLLNTSGLDASAGTSGGGALAITATQQLTLGAGSKQISGFGDTRLTASSDGSKVAGEILASGTGSLQTASTLELTAGRIASVAGANQAWLAQDVSANGGGYKAVTINANAAPVAVADSTALGSRLQITGSGITDRGAIVMKSGSIGLQAMTGSVDVQAGALLDAGGASKDFKGTIATADAGQVSLVAEHGDVLLARDSTVNVAASALGGNAGTLTISGVGTDLSGKLLASAAKGQQGSVALNLSTLADPAAGNAAAGGFSAINATLNAGGFTESRDIRVRDEDLTVAAADVVHAHHLTLESDAGTVQVAGRLDASALLGAGSVDIAGKSVTLASGAVIDASGTSADAGSATSPYANGGTVSVIAEGGTLDFAAGAVVDVRAGAKGSAGSVLLRAPRTPGGASPLAATLAGQVLSRRHDTDAAATVAVEGNQVYALAAGQAVDTATYGADNRAFMQAVAANPVGAAILGDNGAAQGNVHVRSAVEVVAAGDLTMASDWDLTGNAWRIQPVGASALEAGSLVVRAAGNLTFAGASIGNPDTALQAGPTWNIALTSGADLGAANTARTQSTQALAAQVAGGQAGAGDLVLDSSNAEASVRTGTGAIRIAAGRDFVIKAGTDPVTGNPAPGVVYTTGVAAIKDPVTSAADSRFTQGGGDVTITAQRDAVGSGNEWMTEWYRAATQGDDGFGNGVWWAARQNFHDGVAAFGGGNVSVIAGRDVQDLSAWAPTSAIQVGKGKDGVLRTYGGGDLVVRAGNDVVGGQYLLSLGSGAIDAGGDIGGAGQSSQLFLMGMSGDAAAQGASATLRAGGSVTLSTITNPGAVTQTPSTGVGPGFSDSPVLSVLSYSAQSAVGASALSGDLRIGNAPNAALLLNPVPDEDIVSEQLNASRGVAVLPPKVVFQSFNGSISYTGTTSDAGTSEVLFPSLDGGAKLLAAKSITGMPLRVSDVDPKQFEVANLSQSGASVYGDILNGVGGGGAGRLHSNASTDIFINEVVALDGSIRSVTLNFPSRSRIWAANDVFNATLALQNLLPSDVSELVAQDGSIVVGSPTGWGINGPGSLLLQAGHNIDLGIASVTSFGNLRNAALPVGGADIDVLAGYSGEVDLGQLDATFKQLITAGNLKKPEDATAAIQAFLAKGHIGEGDIDSFNTSIQSAAGGSINLMAPGGAITVGLPTPNNSKLIGIVTNAGGAIRSFLKGDFNINQGKVLTAQGGDILIYTTDGGIDAGRGAKTSVTTPPPVRKALTDDAGNVIGYSYSLPVAVAGSGIQTATSKPGGPESVAPKAGDIFLFAPKGTIDAGEAGIASGGAIFIAALTVLNADNISAVGPSQGVPVTPPGSVASTVAAAGGTPVTTDKAGDGAAQAAAAAAAAGVTNFRPAILTVEVMGFGDKNCKESDKDCFAK